MLQLFSPDLQKELLQMVFVNQEIELGFESGYCQKLSSRLWILFVLNTDFCMAGIKAEFEKLTIPKVIFSFLEQDFTLYYSRDSLLVWTHTDVNIELLVVKKLNLLKCFNYQCANFLTIWFAEKRHCNLLLHIIIFDDKKKLRNIH